MESKNFLIVVISGILILGLGALAVFGRGKGQQQDSVTTSRVQESSETTNTMPQQINSSNIKKQYESAPEMQLEQSMDYKAVLHTSKGDITVDLFEGEVPVTVNNFVFLANDGFYDGTRFHRIISGFMIQGGDPLGNGMGGPGYRFDDESFSGQYLRGTIAMANAGPNTNGSQFFIMHEDYPLPENYVIFGRAEDEASLAVIDAIASTPVTQSHTGEMSAPAEDVFVSEIEILTN